MKILRNVSLVAAIALVFACKKQDDGELDKAGATSNETIEVSSDTTSVSRDSSQEGINGSGIGAGEPNTSGEN